MKIIIDKEEKKIKDKKNIDTKSKKQTPRYIVTNSNGIKLKELGLGIFGGVLGGVIVLILGSHFLNLKNTSTNDETNKEITQSYTFATVENPVVAISEKVGPSVVGVKVKYNTKNIWGIVEENSGEGSGIIYSKDGYIITNYHVVSNNIINDASKIYILFPNNDEEFEATLVGKDKLTDVAVLKIDKQDLTAAEFGNSDDIAVGEMAVAIGNPLGEEFAGTVTVGYISATNREITAEGTSYNLIQTDAAINTGNSGGPLVNSKGQVIGINTAKVVLTGVEGIGFAIPTNSILPIIEELITNKKISRPYIGIGGIALSEELAIKYNLVEGIYIQTVDDTSPAYLAGLKQGDVIVEAEKEKVISVAELNEIKYKKKVGDTITVKIYREKEYKDIKIVLAEE